MSRIAALIQQLQLDFGGAVTESWRSIAAGVDRADAQAREYEGRGRVRCPQCALILESANAICPFHTTTTVSDNWAASNRMWCDFFHRGVPLPTLPPEQRFDWDDGRVHEVAPEIVPQMLHSRPTPNPDEVAF